MTTWTVLNSEGDAIASGLSAIEAAREILSHDGHEYEIRRAEDGNGWDLWTSQHSRNSTLGGRPLSKSVIYSLADDEATAEAEIAEKVIAAGWADHPLALADAEHARMIEELAREAAQ